MLINNKNIGYSKEKNVLGAIVAVNLILSTVTLMDGEGVTHTTSINDVIELEELGSIDGRFIYESDVVKLNTTGKVYEFVTIENGEIAMWLLDDKLNRRPNGRGVGFERKQLKAFEGGILELLGNIHELRANKPTVDFNIAIYRNIEDGEVTYWYAGNNKEEEAVDLIKVIFLGHKLIEEDEYERLTYSYEDFLDLVEDKTLVEASPSQLANYVTGLTYGNKNVVAKAEFKPNEKLDVKREALIEEDDKCEECGNNENNCNCELW